jgi:hypothetical protein
MRECLNPEGCEERATVSAAAIVAQGVRGFESTNGNSGSNRRAQVSTSFRKRRGFVAFFGSGSFLDPQRFGDRLQSVFACEERPTKVGTLNTGNAKRGNYRPLRWLQFVFLKVYPALGFGLLEGWPGSTRR